MRHERNLFLGHFLFCNVIDNENDIFCITLRVADYNAFGVENTPTQPRIFDLKCRQQ